MQDMQDKKRQLHHEVHEDSEVKPGSAGRQTGYRDFAFGDQRLTVGSRPAGRRWHVARNNYLFAVPQLRDGQFQVPRCIPPPELLFDG